jgi:hypothetical protein
MTDYEDDPNGLGEEWEDDETLIRVEEALVQAFVDAAERYAEERGLLFRGGSTGEPFPELVDRVSKRESFSSCVAYFGEFVDETKEGRIPERTERAHIRSEAGTVTATIIAPPCCSHRIGVLSL